jgi:transglutaminase-like putative cysteine protease
MPSSIQPKRFPHSFVLILFILVASSAAFAQNPPMEWGKVKPSDIGQTAFPADTGATAVILCEYGESFIDDDLNVAFNYHVRIRILSPAGYKWGSHAVVVNEKKDVETIDDIEGITYTLGADGSVVTHEMDSDAIFKEKLTDDRMRYRFTLPGLTPGCVVEYRYKIVAQSWFYVRDWIFQSTEPTLWSEYRLSHPVQIGYNAVHTGYETFVVNTTGTEQRVVSGRAASYLGDRFANFATMRWAVANAPAIRDEPFITTVKDYQNRVDVQLSGYARGNNQGIEQILQTWDALVRDLDEDKTFGARIEATSAVRTQAQTLTAGIVAETEKVRAIYNWIDTSIVFTQLGWSVRDVDEALEKKRGSSLEIMVLFLSMLRSVGIDGQLVIASSRSHGLIQDLYPIMSQFDAILVRVKAGSRTLFLSPTDPLRPMELLPVDLLGVKGLVIQRRGVEWVTLTSDRQSVRRTTAQIQVKEDGSTEGWLDGQYIDYAALRMRRFAQEKKPHDIAMKFFDLEETDATVDSVIIEGLAENTKPLRVRAHVSSLAGISRVGDKIYAMPMFINREKENPMKHDVRKFPVDFAYPWQQTTVVNLQLPPGYAVVDSVPERTVMVGNDDLLLKRRFQIDTGGVQMSVQFDARKARFEPRVYKELREFYGKVVGIEGEQIVIEKRVPVPPAPAAKPPKTKKR